MVGYTDPAMQMTYRPILPRSASHRAIPTVRSKNTAGIQHMPLHCHVVPPNPVHPGRPLRLRGNQRGMDGAVLIISTDSRCSLYHGPAVQLD